MVSLYFYHADRNMIEVQGYHRQEAIKTITLITYNWKREMHTNTNIVAFLTASNKLNNNKH